MSLLLQIVKQNPTLQSKIIDYLQKKNNFHYSANDISYLVQLFETNETKNNNFVKGQRSKQLCKYLGNNSLFLQSCNFATAVDKEFGFNVKKLLMKEDLNEFLIRNNLFYSSDDQFQSFSTLEIFIEVNNTTFTKKYLDLLANDPEIEYWIVRIFFSRHLSKFLFLEAIKQNQFEMVQIILNFFFNYCSKNENFEILIKILDDPTNNFPLQKMPVLPFAIKRKNMKMVKLLLEIMLKIPNYELKNSNLINVPNAFFNMLIKSNSYVEKFLTKEEVINILKEHDINEILKLLQIPDRIVTKWNLIRLYVIIKNKPKKVTDKM